MFLVKNIFKLKFMTCRCYFKTLHTHTNITVNSKPRSTIVTAKKALKTAAILIKEGNTKSLHIIYVTPPLYQVHWLLIS